MSARISWSAIAAVVFVVLSIAAIFLPGIPDWTLPIALTGGGITCGLLSLRE